MSDIVFALKRAHGDREWRARCIDALDEVARRLQPPGACGRAAREVLAEAADGGGRKR